MHRTVKTNKKHTGRRSSKGFTITEVVVAATLLLLGIVPILRALTGSYISSDRIEHKTRCLFYAQQQLDEANAALTADFDADCAYENLQLEGGYRCSIEQVASDGLKKVVVTVGLDKNSDQALNNDEVLVSLATQVAQRF